MSAGSPPFPRWTRRTSRSRQGTRSHLALLIACLLITPAFVGCLGLGGNDTGTDDSLDTKSRASVSEQTGGIEGVVTDSAIQAIPGVTVAIEELSTSTETREDGSFAFSEQPPGAYTLHLSKEGFIGTEQVVDVQAGTVATTEIVLAHEPTIEPYSQQFSFEGFLECSLATPVVLVAVCSVPPFVINQIPGADGDNSTNDRFIFFHPLEENPWQMVTEMQWEPNQPLARDMNLIVEPEGISNDAKTEFGESEGESPLVVHTDRQRFAEVVANASAVCNEEKDPSALGPPRDSYCSRNYVEDGGEIQIRVFVSNNEATTAQGFTVGAGTAVQQDFTVINTIFYNTPACDEYSVFEGTLCEQRDQVPEQDPYEQVGGNESSS